MGETNGLFNPFFFARASAQTEDDARTRSLQSKVDDFATDMLSPGAEADSYSKFPSHYIRLARSVKQS